MDKERCKVGSFASLTSIFLFVSLVARAAWVQPVSLLNPGQSSPVGGNGDSCLPILNQDGRFVLFASTANNLVITSNNTPIPSLIPARFNVFLRDRWSQTTTLVSVNSSGLGGGDGDSFPLALSTNNLFALFESGAPSLVSGDTNGAADVFLRDLSSGATLLVSANTNGLPGNGASRSAVMTPDGRYVAFVSEANDLVPNDTNRIADVFVRDTVALVTALVSVGARSANPAALWPVGSSESPEITPDGRFVAFSSTATNLMPGVRTVGDIYIHDRLAGTNVWASAGMRPAVQSVTGKTNGICYNLALSADGKFVAYQASLSPLPASTYSGIILRYGLETGVTDLIHTNAVTSIPSAENSRSLDLTPDGQRIAFVANSNGVAGTTTCVQVWDAASGMISLASSSLSGAVPTNSVSSWPFLDSTGRYVAFLSNASGLVTNGALGDWHLYVRDLQAATTALVDVGTNGTAAGVTSATVPALSADGRFIAFECPDGNLVPDDNNHRLDVFVRDMVAGTNELISARHPTLASSTPNSLSALTQFSASDDGRFIAYASDADNLVASDTNGYRDVFVRDMATGRTILVSADVAGVSGNGPSFEPAISGDGRFIAFASSATNLVADDTNKLADIFVRDLQAVATVLASRRPDGRPSDGSCSAPLLSKDGRWLLFRSQARYLTGDFIGFTGNLNLFLRDTQSATNWALTTMSVDALTMTPDGRFVAYLSRPGDGAGAVYSFVWDSSLAARVFTNATSASYGFGVASSPDGKRIASVTATQLVFMDREANTTWSVAAASPSTWTAPAFSADGKWLAYARQLAATNQVFLRDLDSGATSLLSHVWNSVEPGSGGSDSPVISPSGRFVAYRTWATNLVAGACSAFRQIMLYDRQTGLNTLLSTSRFSDGPADDHSLRARFSADGQTLLIQSWASDLAANDLNASGDLFATAIFTMVILPPATPGQGPVLSWPLMPGDNPRVQCKDDLDDPIWRDCSGSITNDGWKAWLQDSPATNAQRFYRVIAF